MKWRDTKKCILKTEEKWNMESCRIESDRLSRVCQEFMTAKYTFVTPKIPCPVISASINMKIIPIIAKIKALSAIFTLNFSLINNYQSYLLASLSDLTL